MVAHLSYKLTHFAQTLRTGHFTTTLRNAFPSTQAPSFDFTSNVFGVASGGSGIGIGMAAGAFGAGAGAGAAAQAGNGAAGGAGGASSKAGSWSSWGFQSTKSLQQGQAAQADSPSQLEEDDLRSLASSPAVRRSLHRRRSPLGVRRTSHSTLSPSSPKSSAHPGLLMTDEAGLSGVRLSSAQMQLRYHSAFAQRGEAEADEVAVEEKEAEADELDFGQPSEVLRTGRRASTSASTLNAPRSSLLVSATGLNAAGRPRSLSRPLHLSASSSAPFSSASLASPSRLAAPTTPFSAAPPTASTPRLRRNSTSAVPTPTSDLPLSPNELPPRPRTPRYPVERRPPIENPKDGNYPRKGKANWTEGKSRDQIVERGEKMGTLMSPEARERRSTIQAAERSRNSERVARAVQQYLADPSTWNSGTHNEAMSALYATRRPNEPLDRIIELYNQLFSTKGLHPTRRSYELVLKSFASRDEEVCRNIGYLERRIKKKVLAAKARGDADSRAGVANVERDRDDDRSDYAMDAEAERLSQLRSSEFDYFTPAIQIFKALGPLGDRMPVSLFQQLMACAVERGEVDVALALFERLEKSPFTRPNCRAYEILCRAYGSVEKNPALVMEVLEGYLAARASGALRETEWQRGSRPVYRYTSVKHAYDTEPDWVVDESQRKMKDAGGSTDELVWGAAIKGLFDAGDSAGAVGLLERLLIAQNEPAKLAAGYPASLTGRTVSLVVKGFINAGDEAAAQRWFDRFAAPAVDAATLPPVAFYTACLYTAVDSPFLGLLNHIYRTMLAVATAAERPLFVSDFVTVIDYNLAQTWSSERSAEEKQVALDAVAEFRAAFEQATKAGLLDDNLTVDFTASTGFLARVAAAEGAHNLFERSTATFLELANMVRAIVRDTPEDPKRAERDGRRSRAKWTRVISSAANYAGGLRRVFGSADKEEVELRPADAPLPAVQDLVKIVSWTNKLRRVVDWAPQQQLELALVQSYLASREAAQSDVRAFDLHGDAWFTVLEAFAYTASHVKRNPEAALPFAFPGFALAFQDFLASGAEIPIAHGMYNYDAFAKNLRVSGMHPNDVRAALEAMLRTTAVDSRLSMQQQVDESKIEEVAPAAPAGLVEDDAVSLASGSAAPATSATARSVSDAAESEPVQQFPTPPSTPPAYFAELDTARPTTPTPQAANFDRKLGTQIEQLSFVGRTADASRLAREAFTLTMDAASQGRFAHPDAYGRLIEQLGRQHLIAEVRQVYLVAYEALNAMAAEPEQQSVAWVGLEDRMIVALAQAGELTDVGHHRDRLLQAGCAPSADGYAAMILNMRDTTDDALVALTLFEESQRLGVRPNVYLFNTLISKLSRARRAKAALEYFELMKQHGLVPSSITYGAIINACCKTGDDVSAEYLFAEMVTRPDFKPRVPPYNTMLQHYVSTKPDRQRALHYYNELVKANVRPTAHTYKLLLDAYGSIGEPDLEAMQQVFLRLHQDRQVSISGAHWASMITGYGVNAKDVDRAIAIFNSISAHPSTRNNPNGPLPDAVVYEALLNALIANGRADLCDQYLEEMRNKGVRMTAYVANTLIKGYAAQSLFVSARHIFAAMSEPPSGVASVGNHPIDRHPKHHHLASQTPADVNAPTYREPSTYEAMILCELKAGETVKAAEVLRLAEARAFPPAVIGRLRKILADEGIEALPLSY
ncbi:hypothetical protein JCM10207_002192 [Rhodosporidiobolus poonsookiae]